MKKHAEKLSCCKPSMPKGNSTKSSRSVATGGSGKHGTKNGSGWSGRKYKATNSNG